MSSLILIDRWIYGAAFSPELLYHLSRQLHGHVSSVRIYGSRGCLVLWVTIYVFQRTAGFLRKFARQSGRSCVWMEGRVEVTER